MEQTEFNMAFSYLGRLNQLFYQADNSAMNLDSHGWFHSLLALFRELSPYLKDGEVEESKTVTNKINLLINSNNKKNDRTGKKELSSELYFELHNFELSIRDIVKRTGLQMRMEQDPSKALQ